MKKTLKILSIAVMTISTSIMLVACGKTTAEMSPIVVDDLQVTVETNIIEIEEIEGIEIKEIKMPNLTSTVAIEAVGVTIAGEPDDEIKIPMPSVNTIEFNDDGIEIFGELEFANEGIFEYRIFQEVAIDEAKATGITADDEIFQVLITVELDNNELISTIDMSEIVFVNTYDQAITVAQELVAKLDENSEREALELAIEIVEAISTNEVIQAELLTQVALIDTEITARKLAAQEAIELEQAKLTEIKANNVTQEQTQSGQTPANNPPTPQTPNANTGSNNPPPSAPQTDNNDFSGCEFVQVHSGHVAPDAAIADGVENLNQTYYVWEMVCP